MRCIERRGGWKGREIRLKDKSEVWDYGIEKG